MLIKIRKKSLIFLFSLLALIFLMPVCSHAKEKDADDYDACKDIKEASGKDFSYKKVKGGIQIVSYNGKMQSYRIPSKIDGKKVVDVYVGYTKSSRKHGVCGKEVVLPDTVETLRFRWASTPRCINIQTLYIGKNVKSMIDDFALEYSDEDYLLEAFVVSPENKKFYSKDGVLYERLEDGSRLCFYPDGKKDSSYTTPNEVTEININAFGPFNTNLKKVVIGKNVRKMGGDDDADRNNYVFSRLSFSELEEVVVAKGNKYYYSKNGVLFKKKGNVLIYYPRGKKDKTYKIPEGTKKIRKYAFESTDNLTKVIIPSSVKKIYKTSFFQCYKTKSRIRQ